MVAGSRASKRRPRRAMSSEEQAQAARDVQGAVSDLQEVAYANLRKAVANVAIFFGFVGVFALVAGVVDGLRLIPITVLVLAGVGGVSYYPARRHEQVGLRILLLSSTLVVIGLAGLVLVASVLEK
ncbi:hypothetical protein [Micromonospora sp. LOL_024]|uniref:hypothetical protein n=1 Tax=Micromonospora sp. LOL_024 TaxID=3345412 RepID=UPI003A859B67